ncbi:MAG: hypothetical protein KAR45_23290 [Desulfobacteraceae bacterium]|nr:hypothetical protein [Desulfobacteraceae bacterium]
MTLSMNLPMKQAKYLIFPLAALLILHLGLVYFENKETLKLLNDRTKQFQGQIVRLESRKVMASKKLEFYVVIYQDLKPWLMTGFEDPEEGLVKFLDYLSPSLLEKVNANVNIQHSNVGKRQPIPLQLSSFTIDFDFLYTYEIENFLKALFLQDQYPIKVRTARIQRQQEQRTKAEVSFDLLIPANLKQLDFNEFNNS